METLWQDVRLGFRTLTRAPFVGVPLLLATMALAASYIPAFRATRIDPAVALRGE
jgi:ABC-type lipoprotein release transport system permease subunit